MNMLNLNLSNHQYHIATNLCLLQLNLLQSNDIIKLTHHLMNAGLYDDLMLTIIDDYLIQSELHSLLLKVCQKLDLPTFNEIDLKFIFTFNKILPCFTLPTNPDLYDDEYIWDYFELSWFDEKEKLHNDLIDAIYQFHYDLEIFRDRNDNYTILDNFLTTCQSWINKHHTTLTQILTPFTQIKIP